MVHIIVNQIDPGLDETFAALGNAHRRRIVDLVSWQPMTISAISQHVGLSLPAMSRHIAILEKAGLVIRRKIGRVTFLSISRVTMRSVQDWAMQYNAAWGTDDETLTNYLPAMEADHPVAPAAGPRRKEDER